MILERYLYREISRTFLAVFVLLLPIYLSHRFVQYLAEAAAGKIGSEVILKLLGLKLLSAFVLILTLCFYVATYLALRRLNSDNELTAMASFGLNTRFLLRAVLKFAGLGALIVAIFSLYITPWAEGRYDELKKKMVMESDITGIMAGRFKEFGEGNNILYVEDMSRDQKNLKNVFLQKNQNNQFDVLTSNSARVEMEKKSGDRFAVFSAGRLYSGMPGQLDYTVIEYQKYGERMDFNDKDNTAQARHAAPSVTLWKLGDKVSVAELQWRFSMPLQALILALAAVMLVKASSERGRFAWLLSAILIYFVYSNLLGIARNLVRKGALPTYLGVWWVHALLLALILFLYFYPALRRWRLSHP